MENPPNTEPKLESYMDILSFFALAIQSDMATRCRQSHKDCFGFLNYLLGPLAPEGDKDNPNIVIAPDYCLLATHSDPLTMEARELVLSTLELLFELLHRTSYEISWEDGCGKEWRTTAAIRLLASN